VVRLHGDESEGFLFRSSFGQQSVFTWLLLHSLRKHPTADSFRLWAEIAELLPPYVALGFDQHQIYKEKKEIIVTMDHFQTIKHLAQYGRPL
jgi:hypothetical protein